MRHNDLKKLVEKIGNHAQEVAEAASNLVNEIEAVDAYERPTDWIEEVTLMGEDFIAELDILIAELDILATEAAEARDAAASALTDDAVV